MKTKQFAEIIFTGLDRFSQVVNSYGQAVNTARAFTEMSVPISSGAKAFNHACVPLHIAKLISVGFEPITMGKSLNDMIKAPKYLKLMPALKFGTCIGNILDAFTTVIWICEQLNTSGIQALTAASIPIGGVAIGLQALGIGILAWKVHSIHKQWKKIENTLGKNPLQADYKSAVHLLTKKPDSKKEKYTQKFFGVLTNSQKTAIKKVYKGVKAGNLDIKQLSQTMSFVKKYHFLQKIQNISSIALMIIGVVGLTVIAFGPTPIAPIAWGVMGCVGVASMGLFAYSMYQNYQFNSFLKKSMGNANLNSSA